MRHWRQLRAAANPTTSSREPVASRFSRPFRPSAFGSSRDRSVGPQGDPRGSHRARRGPLGARCRGRWSARARRRGPHHDEAAPRLAWPHVVRSCLCPRGLDRAVPRYAGAPCSPCRLPPCPVEPPSLAARFSTLPRIGPSSCATSIAKMATPDVLQGTPPLAAGGLGFIAGLACAFALWKAASRSLV